MWPVKPREIKIQRPPISPSAAESEERELFPLDELMKWIERREGCHCPSIESHLFQLSIPTNEDLSPFALLRTSLFRGLFTERYWCLFLLSFIILVIKPINEHLSSIQFLATSLFKACVLFLLEEPMWIESWCPSLSSLILPVLDSNKWGAKFYSLLSNISGIEASTKVFADYSNLIYLSAS